MGETAPATKNELSRHLASGYLLSNVLRAEPTIDDAVELLPGWLDKHADERRPIDLDRFFTYTTFDVVGEVIFFKSFGFLREGNDIGVTWLNILPFGHIVDTAKSAIDERRKNPEARFDAVAH